MSQDTHVIAANQSGTNYRTQDNAGKAAINSSHLGSSAASYQLAGMMWLDSSASPIYTWKMYDGTDQITIGTFNITTNVFSPANAPLLDGSRHYAADSVGTDSYAVTITGGATLTTGLVLTIKCGTANTGACSLNYNSGGALAIKKMSGTAYVDLNDNDIIANQFIQVVYNGSIWVLFSLNDAYFVNNQTAVTTLQTTDHLIIADDSDSDKNKKITLANTKLALDTNLTATVALTDAATIDTDASLGNVFTVTLGGNRTLGAPTNPTNGQKILYQIKQDGTGSRTLAYNAIFRFGTDVTSPTLTTTASKTDYLGFIYSSADTKWDCLAVAKGY